MIFDRVQIGFEIVEDVQQFFDANGCAPIGRKAEKAEAREVLKHAEAFTDLHEKRRRLQQEIAEGERIAVFRQVLKMRSTNTPRTRSRVARVLASCRPRGVV